MDWYRILITVVVALIRLSISPHEQDPEIRELLHLKQELSSNLKRASHLFSVENHYLGLGGVDPHPSCFTIGSNPLSACCRFWLLGAFWGPAGPRHLQKGETKSTAPQTRPCLDLQKPS
ncbi:hypothetical protein ATANTOWER_021047 [Ataeniobius toweri]|uniref:Uncharacterized protein n=1 Tax=Ataeniobius toweri TaxID=208326 RepID=A0ABU7B8B9_9TELE|nr:hypothetical protein [Ataeniobius toweri]